MAEEVISVHEDFYILSTSSSLDDRTRVLKNGDTFAVFDRFGDISRLGNAGLGIYHEDTRFLSRFSLKLGENRPLLLSSSTRDDNAILAVDLMNPDFLLDDNVLIPRGTLHIFRSKLLWNGSLHERFRIHNYGPDSAPLDLFIKFEADFADIFEVRGMARGRRGHNLPTDISSNMVLLSYEGLDQEVRRTRITFEPRPESITESEVRY